MKYFRNKYVLSIILLSFNIIYFILVATLFGSRFEENDDVLMCLIANGNYAGSPDYHLVFQNALWGCFLSAFYSMTNSIEWYSLFLSIAHIVAITIIVYIIIQTLNNISLQIAFLICIYVIWAVMIQSFQFTTTASIMCIAGCLLIANNTNGHIWGGVAILISAFIRYQATGLILLLFLPSLLIIYRRPWKKYFVVIGAFLIVFSTRIVDKYFYKTDVWSYYYEYNALRGEINDNMNTNTINQNDLKKIGVDEVDYAMLCNFFPDPQIITLPTLRKIHNSVKQVPINYKIRNIYQLEKFRIPILLLLTLSVFIIFSIESHYKRLLFLCWFGFFLVLLCGLCLEHTLKNRVFLSALLAMVSFYALTPFVQHKQLLCIAISLCLFGFCIKYGFQCFKVNANREAKAQIWNEQISLLKMLPENSFVLPVSQLQIEEISPYQIKNFHIKLYPHGWLTAIPFNQNIGLSHSSLINSNVYLFAKKGTSVDGIVDYIESKYNNHVTVDTIIQNEQYSIIQLNKDIGL